MRWASLPSHSAPTKTTCSSFITGPEIDATHLSILDRGWNAEGKDDDPEQTIHIPDIGMTLVEIKAEALRITLKLTDGNRSAAARILAISRPTIHRKIRDYGLEEGV
jgi:transcriptional regulator of acetoin/glycerol metabolism